MILNEQIFWTVIGLFYLSRQIRFLEAHGAYLFVASSGRLKAVVPAAPFETALGLLVVLNPLAPCRVAIQGQWGMLPPGSPSEVRRDWSTLIRVTRKLGGIRILATLAWLVLFVLGPALTWQFGLGRALLIVTPLWVFIYGMAAYCLIFGALSSVGIKFNIGMLLFECLVCPGFVPALPAMLTRHLEISVDICQLARRHQSAADWARLAATIERRIAYELVDDPSREADMNRYRALVLG